MILNGDGLRDQQYEVRYDGENRNGVSFWVIVDTRTGDVRATWTVPWAAYEQCAWLNGRVR